MYYVVPPPPPPFDSWLLSVNTLDVLLMAICGTCMFFFFYLVVQLVIEWC